jgi:hypothetical protein
MHARLAEVINCLSPRLVCHDERVMTNVSRHTCRLAITQLTKLLDIIFPQVCKDYWREHMLQNDDSLKF